MTVETFNSLEGEFLSKFNEGYRTFEALKDIVPFNEKTLKNIIEKMVAKNIIILDTVTKEYKYDSPIKGDKVILSGNIMLPISIIRFPNKILVSRGAWYSFEPDFDVRRIIWNVQLNSTKKSTLIDLLKESVLKERKSKIVQVEEYKQLVNKLIPWSDKISLKINAVGENNTDVSIIFKDRIYTDLTKKEDYIEFKGFNVRSEIKTEELIHQLTVDKEQRNFSEININRIFNFSDFVFSGNEIPYSSDEESISYVKITGIKSKIELTYFMLDNIGQLNQLDKETYLDINEGLKKIRECFSSYAENLILQNDILVELTD